MFVAIMIITILISLRYADWKNWQRYQSTMLLFGFGSLLYGFVYCNSYLWKFNSNLIPFKVLELLHVFTVFPISILMMLSFLPDDKKAKAYRIVKFIAIYIIVEYVLHLFGKIEYDRGWSIWWSFAWNCVMFPILFLHHKKPVPALVLSVGLIFIMYWLFPFNLH